MDQAIHLSWARSLDYVLTDRPALDAFREWLVEYSSPQYLDLHFAIRAYDRMVAEGNQKRTELAKTIYSKYISLRTGCCDGIPSKLRSQIGDKVRMMAGTGNESDGGLFTTCATFVDDYLRRQHEQFVCSDEFIEAFNKFSITDQQCTSTISTMDRKSESRRNAAQMATQLTAEALLKSRHDRQTTLGEIKLEKMYPPTRQPYVCNATTSHNDSAVSSSFSGDTSSSHKASRMRHIREQQARGNPVTFTVPRVETVHRKEGRQFDHSSSHGRKQFVQAVTEKLHRLLGKMKLNDETERKINDIEKNIYSTIDMVKELEADEEMVEVDEDDELDDYLKRLKDDSQRASANRSPHISCDAFSPSRESRQHSRMAQSMLAYSHPDRMTNFTQISLDSFAPPPMNHTFNTFSAYNKRKDSGSQMYDSSGIGSMAPSAFSATTSDASSSSKERRHRHRYNNSLTTPRRHKNRQNLSNLITISYIDKNGVPVVAHVPNNGPMTLAEFRQYFMLSTNMNSQLFFRSECEDGSAPHQLLLIKDDNEVLPIFEGRIAAELR